jgi:hypothetical protein
MRNLGQRNSAWQESQVFKRNIIAEKARKGKSSQSVPAATNSNELKARSDAKLLL